MTLITSISGIRGTIGGKAGQGLTPSDIVKFTSGYAAWLKSKQGKSRCRVVLGRDARVSGPMLEQLVSGSLAGMGVDVIQIGLTTTPTVEIAVKAEIADGGIILTASHNPAQWNALKLLNSDGEFLSSADGEEVLRLAESGNLDFSPFEELGATIFKEGYNEKHIEAVLNLKLVNRDLITRAGFRVAIDCVNSTGGLVIPTLLKKLGVKEVIELYCTPNGIFPHNPEPLPEHLTELSKTIVNQKADLGFSVDPDVDRLAIVCEDGSMFGEEYTLVAVADYVLGKTPGNTASNLSSTRALRDITHKYGCSYFASPVGEVNVVEAMKKNSCVIGGEGNGGVIYPEFHYGRDALAGIALFLTHMAERKLKCSELRKTYPDYYMSKNKILLTPGINPDELLSKVKESFTGKEMNDSDGLKLEFEDGWVHLRKSNTEPIMRVYSEHRTEAEARNIAEMVIREVRKFM